MRDETKRFRGKEGGRRKPEVVLIGADHTTAYELTAVGGEMCTTYI
jgi:hypothetical protein